MVLTESDYIDFLKSSDEHELPREIRLALSTSLLLFIGFSISDFSSLVLFSYLNKTISARLLDSPDIVLQLPPTPSYGYDNIKKIIEYLSKYFRRQYGSKVYWGDAQSFSSELRERLDNFRRRNAEGFR
jgi:hypothetical protein